MLLASLVAASGLGLGGGKAALGEKVDERAESIRNLCKSIVVVRSEEEDALGNLSLSVHAPQGLRKVIEDSVLREEKVIVLQSVVRKKIQYNLFRPKMMKLR